LKVILLAGGFGIRLSEYTESIPKPMVTIGGQPILWHIMRSYAHFGFKDFYIALGYKAQLIKNYFLHYHSLNADFTVDLSTGSISRHQSFSIDWRVTLVNTGTDSMTGGRVKRLKSLIGDETFMLTYGDGLADIDLSALLDFHRGHGRMVTVTAVRPVARFGELKISNDRVIDFKEKAQMNKGWINGGYFVIEPSFFELLADDHTVLEREPLEQAAYMGELMAFRHEGFWQCMDTKRERDMLEELWSSGKAAWKV